MVVSLSVHTNFQLADRSRGATKAQSALKTHCEDNLGLEKRILVYISFDADYKQQLIKQIRETLNSRKF